MNEDKVYLVFKDGNEDPIAVCLDINLAFDIAEFEEEETGRDCFVQAFPLIQSIGDYC